MRRPVSLFVAILAVLALAGCVGIPTSGGVNDGEVIDDQANPEFVVLPSGPEAGSSQEKILDDFMQAVRGPQNGYGVARQFLTSEFSDVWKPDASTLIRTAPAVVESSGTDTLSYTVTSRASVDELGQYTEERDAATQTLTFGFAKENGEWRISQAADGVVLSQASFNVAFREQALYFFDPSYSYLVPDVRWFPSRQTSSVRVVTALLAGPSAWLQQGVLVSAFPEATALGADSVRPASGAVVVDLSTEALAATPVGRDRMRQQLVATLVTPNVQLTVRGLDLVTPDASGDRAVVNPSVDTAVLAGTATAFGFDAGSGIVPIEGLTDPVTAAGAVRATLATDRQVVAVLGANGVVSVARTGDAATQAVDSRPGLIAPSIDPFRFVWSAQGSAASSLTTFELDGTVHPVQSALPADSRVVSLDVSRDGARLLLMLASPVGSRLLVAGIIRQDNVPIGLGPIVELPADAGDPVDATWVDDRTVASVTATIDGAVVTAFELGGPSTPLGAVTGAIAIAGGNAGADGLRVLSSDGTVWRPRGSQGWVSTGVVASFIGTKQ